MGHKVVGLTAAVLIAVVCYADVAQAQWVFVARKGLGIVNRLVNQATDKDGQGYDVATVLLEADANKVYSTAVDLLTGNSSLTITHRDDPNRTIEFTDGKILAGMKVSRLEDHLAQILISSTVTPGKPSGTSFVVGRVFQVCEKMGVHCTLGKD